MKKIHNDDNDDNDNDNDNDNDENTLSGLRASQTDIWEPTSVTTLETD